MITIHALGTEIEIEDACLDVRWWTWTEYEWVGVKLGEIEDGYERPIATHRVVTLGYHPFDDGRERLLWATEDGRLHAGSAHSVFPILDDAAALDGAEAFRNQLLQGLAVEPTLL